MQIQLREAWLQSAITQSTKCLRTKINVCIVRKWHLLLGSVSGVKCLLSLPAGTGTGLMPDPPLWEVWDSCWLALQFGHIRNACKGWLMTVESDLFLERGLLLLNILYCKNLSHD